MTGTLRSGSGAAFVTGPRDLAGAPFRPEGVNLRDYVFVPWVRTGLVAAITDPPASLRARITAQVDVVDADDASARQTVARDLTLYGPADVTGLDAAQIIRREPRPGTRDAEQGFLAHVEFARPDVPWMMSPFPARDDLCRPWLALIVVEARLSRIEPGADDRPARLWTQKGQVQSLHDAHLYAHAQVVGAQMDAAGPVLRGDGPGSVQTRLSDEHAPANLSRILCPRRLDDGVDYIAALVPAFDCGAKAGLGLPLHDATLNPAWTRHPGDDQDALLLPVYDHWTFATAAGGNFGELAGRIRPVTAPWQVGRLAIDITDPGGGVPALAPGAPGGVQRLDCALYSPAQPPVGAVPPWPAAQRKALRDRINQANADGDVLPRIGARMYARYQRAANRVAASGQAGDWFAQINTDPMHRIVAALGARVVQRDQEKLMQAAWAQVAGIRRANQALAWASMAQVVNGSIIRRHLDPLDAGRLLQVTRAVHDRIRDGGAARSVAAAVTHSRTADGTMDAAFRRAMRPDGPVARRAGLSGAATARLIHGDGGFRDHRIDAVTPDGIKGLSAVGRAFFAIDLVAHVMGVPVASARSALDKQIDLLAARGPAIGQLQAARWNAGVATGLGDVMGAQMLDRIGKALPATATARPVAGAERLAQIAVGVQLTGGALAGKAKTRLTQVTKGVAPQTLALRPQPGFAPPSVSIPSRSQPATTRGLPGGGLATRRGPVILDRAPPPATPPQPDPAAIRFETDLSRRIGGILVQMNAMKGDRFAQIVRSVAGRDTQPPQVRTDPGPLVQTRAGILAQIDPVVTARAAFRGRILARPDFLPPDWFDRLGLAPIMAAPVFHRPMYAALAEMDRDWLVPGLGAIAERDFVTVLTINPGFAEAFLIGASDEMGRELLWRDYPTDQRGTYFRRFWDGEQDELTTPIHRFARTPLGRHFTTGGPREAGSSDPLALVVRGALLRRFPDTFLTAMRASPSAGAPVFDGSVAAQVLFQAPLDPDYVVVGFDLTRAQIRTDKDWWFVLAQHPTAPRFGLATGVAGAPPGTQPGAQTDRDNLDWADFGPVPPGGFLGSGRSFDVRDPSSLPARIRWPGHAGHVARVLLSNPVRAAFRAETLILSS